MKFGLALGRGTSGSSLGEVFIAGSPDNPLLATSEGMVLNTGSEIQVARLSNLAKLMIDLNWLCPEHLIVSGSDDRLARLTSPKLLTGGVPSRDNQFSEITDIGLLDKTEEGLLSELVKFGAITEKDKNDIMTRINKKSGVDLFDSSKVIVDLDKKMTSSVIISPSSEIYTDSVDLSRKLGSGISEDCLIELNINFHQYLSTDSQETRMTSFCTTFPAFRIGEDGKYSLQDRIVDGDAFGRFVQIEFLSGLLRVIPKKELVKECIINGCTLHYGTSIA